MESQEPPKNDHTEGTGFFKRRISSILKPPGKLARFADPEQQENVVERAKPEEKRNSRRVSFAAANDVLLFSKDAKSTSPVRCALQELASATGPASQNRVQLAAEEEVQPITAMDTLLNAPLHGSQQQDTVRFDSVGGFGEKTVMFSSEEDAFMDMTHSHTMLISADFSFQNRGASDKNAADSSQDLSTEKKKTTPKFYPGFEDFLLSISQPPSSSSSSSSAAKTNSSVAAMKRQNVNKENLLPVSVMTKAEEPGLGTNPAQDQTGPVLSDSDDDNPFPLFFPNRESKARSNKERSKTMAMTKSAPEDPVPSKTPRFNVLHPKPKVNHDGGDRTLRFAADEVFMDTTPRHTVSRGPVPPQQVEPPSLCGVLNRSVHVGAEPQTPLAPAGQDKTIRFDMDDDGGMDMTRCLTGKIETLDAVLPEIQSVKPLRDRSSSSDPQKEETLSGRRESSKRAGLGFPLKPSLKVKQQNPRDKSDAEDERRERTVRFSADDVDAAQSHGVHVGAAVPPTTSHLAPAGGDKTIRFDVDDAGMDMTRCLTVNIHTLGHDHATFPEKKPQRGRPSLSAGAFRRKSTAAAPFPEAEDASVCPGAYVTQAQTGRILGIGDPGHLKVADLMPGPDKTIRFDLDDAGMDMTRCLTGKIDLDPVPPEIQSVTRGPPRNPSVHIGTHVQLQTPLAPVGPDKTIRFDMDDAGMDMTRCLTGKIETLDAVLPEIQSVKPLRDRSSLRVCGVDGGVKMTEAQSANRAGLRFSLTPSLLTNQPKQQGNSDLGEKTVRFSADDMDVTQSHTVHISSDLQLQPQPSSLGGDKTTRFDGNDGGMDMTRCLTVNILNDFGSDSVFLPEKRREVGVSFADSATERNSSEHRKVTEALDSVPAADQEPNMATYVMEPFHRNTDSQFSVKKRGRSLAAERSLGLGLESSSSRMSAPWIDPARAAAPDAPPEDPGAKGRLEVGPGPAAPGLVSVATESTAYFDLSMEMTEAQTGRVLAIGFGDELPRSQDSDAKVELLEPTEATSPQSQETLAPNAAKETTSTPNQSDANQDEDEERPCKSRRMSLADLQSKLRRMSQAACAAPVPSAAPETNTSADKEAQDQSGEIEAPATPVPFNSKTNQLMSRLSMGAFRGSGPRLDPARAAAPDAPLEDPDAKGHLAVDPGPAAPGLVFAAAANPGGESTAYFDLSMEMTEAQTGRVLGRSFGDELRQETASSLIQSDANRDKSRRMSLADLQSELRRRSDAETNIFAEELDSVEDSVEEQEEGDPQGADAHQLPQEVAFDEDFIGTAQGKEKKMAPPEDEVNTEDEKRLEATDELVDMELPPDPLERDGTATSGRSMSALTCDFSGHAAGVRHEATFESTLKHSTMFESQLEDYACDAQTKLREGTITVLEFLKLFNIDFVIHNPRQSILPGRISPEEDQTHLDALRDRHISRPKQLVYERDVRNLTEKVEGLKVRLQDLHKPLVLVNQSLWEEMSNASETQLRAFGAALKQRNNLFRKTSKALSHQMKEELYSNVVQANREEQRKLRGTIQQADEMIRSLDDCIGHLEAELTAVEETGSQGKPSLKSLQEEIKKANEALSEKERKISELELETKQNLTKLSRVKAETRNLQELQDTVHLVNEWKLGENNERLSVFTFLHDTLRLRLLYEKSTGDGAVKKISKIDFRFELNEEKSRCCARLVHTLLTRHVQSQTSWVDKYPTSRHVPQLLHDVSLVVSRCRLLGEELRLLALWGGLRLDILHISCEDTRVHIVFSSLKKLAKFEVDFDVCLTDGCPALKVQRVKNVIGSTPIHQIEDMVASFAPSKNLLTKIIKKIHEGLLC